VSFINDIFKSFSNDPGGWSGRKISAATGVITAVYIGVRLLPESDRIYAVYAFLMFSSVCLGLVTIPELIKFLSLRSGSMTKETKIEEKTEVK